MVGSNLQIPGLVSGLSTADIVQKMMDIERMPLNALQSKKDVRQQKADAIRDIRTRLSNLLSKMQALTTRSTIDAKTVTTDIAANSPVLVTASASSDAAQGSFTVKVAELATSAKVSSASGPASPAAVGKVVQSNQPLASAGFAMVPNTGSAATTTFTVNGARIEINAATVLGDAADAPGTNSIFAKIRDTTGVLADANKHVTVQLTTDPSGRQNRLRLVATDPIQLGSGSDTSNFLTVAGLNAQPMASTVTGARNLGGVRLGELLSSTDANLDVALAATGSFKINGVEISYDTSKDTLNDVISRINSSAANVTATFDGASDRLTLTARATGTALIDLEDVGVSNFLAAMKLSTANETPGTNAKYYLNGEADPRYSSSNAVTDAVAGVTLNLKKTDLSTTVSLTVSQDTASTVSAVQAFVDQYNSAMNFIREKTAYDADLKKASVLTGDSTVLNIQSNLASLISGTGVGLSSSARSLAEIGITTGSIGTTPGEAVSLAFNSSKLTAKLQSNPSAVADLFAGLKANVSLAGGGTGSIASISGIPARHVSGTYAVVSDISGNLTATFIPSGGGADASATGKITVSGTNVTLIPGVTLTGKGVLAAGSDSIAVDFTSVGVGVKIADYLTSLTSSKGLLASKQDQATDQISDLNDSVRRLQVRLEEKEDALYRKFSALEVALSRLQSQSASLNAQLSSLV